MINHKPSNEVICLLDSSDEEDVEMGREEARTDICEAIDMSGVLPQARMEVDSSPKSSSAQRPQSAPDRPIIGPESAQIGPQLAPNWPRGPPDPPPGPTDFFI